MNAPDYRWQQEAEEERFMFELALCQRIARGAATEQDALYVAASFGLKTEFQQETANEMGR